MPDPCNDFIPSTANWTSFNLCDANAESISSQAVSGTALHCILGPDRSGSVNYRLPTGCVKIDDCSFWGMTIKKKKRDLHSAVQGNHDLSPAEVRWGQSSDSLGYFVAHLAVLLVLAPHLSAETPGRLAGSVWRDDVVVDQSRQVSPHGGQVSTVGQPWTQAAAST